MKVNKQKLQEMYTEYQMLMQQMQQLQQNLQELQRHVSDLNNLKKNLDEISFVELNTETLVPLGNGIFLHAELKDNKNIVMNVGSDVFVDKTFSEAKETVDKQMNEVTNVVLQMEQEIEKATYRIEEIQEEFQKISPEDTE